MKMNDIEDGNKNTYNFEVLDRYDDFEVICNESNETVDVILKHKGNYRTIKYVPCCYYCKYFVDFFEDDPYCKHPKMDEKLVEPIGICDNFDDEQSGN